MNTYVAEHVLTDYTDGMLVLKAETLEDAYKMIEEICYEDEDGNIKEGFNFAKHHDRFDRLYADGIKKNLRLLKDNEIVYVWGGG